MAVGLGATTGSDGEDAGWDDLAGVDDWGGDDWAGGDGGGAAVHAARSSPATTTVVRRRRTWHPAAMIRTPRRSSALAGILSIPLPGLGHLYLGRYRRALAFFGAGLVVVALMFVAVGFLLGPGLAIYAAIDAVRINEGHEPQPLRAVRFG